MTILVHIHVYFDYITDVDNGVLCMQRTCANNDLMTGNWYLTGYKTMGGVGGGAAEWQCMNIDEPSHMIFITRVCRYIILYKAQLKQWAPLVVSTPWTTQLILAGGEFSVRLFTAITATVDAAAFVMNAFLMVVLIKSRRLHTLENCFVVNLVVYDFLYTVGVVGHVTFWNLTLPEPQRISVCFILMVQAFYLIAAQFIALWIMTIDRFIKILYPFTHNRICTKLYVTLVLLSGHLISLVGAITSGLYFSWDPQNRCNYIYTYPDFLLISLQTTVLVGLVVIVVMNIKILLVSKQQQKQIRVQNQPEPPTVGTSTNVSTSSNKVLGSLALFTFITYQPSCPVLAAKNLGVAIDKTVLALMIDATSFLWMLNPLLDALLFLLIRKDIKEYAIKLLKHTTLIEVTNAWYSQRQAHNVCTVLGYMCTLLRSGLW